MRENTKKQVIKDLKERLRQLVSTNEWRWEECKKDEQTIIALKEMIAELESN